MKLKAKKITTVILNIGIESQMFNSKNKEKPQKLLKNKNEKSKPQHIGKKRRNTIQKECSLKKNAYKKL